MPGSVVCSPGWQFQHCYNYLAVCNAMCSLMALFGGSQALIMVLYSSSTERSHISRHDLHFDTHLMPSSV